MSRYGVRPRLVAMAATGLDEIRKLSVAERIQLVEDIWDSMAEEAAALPVPEGLFAKLSHYCRLYGHKPTYG